MTTYSESPKELDPQSFKQPETVAEATVVKELSSDVIDQVEAVLLKKSWVQKIQECKSPDDFLKLFQQAGIPEGKWKSSKWLTVSAKLSPEEGGISQTFKGLYEALQKRFEGYPQFVAWMMGKKRLTDMVENCKSPQDFLQLFKELGIPEDKWKSTGWFAEKSKLPPEEGGAGLYLNGLRVLIRKRFGAHPQFVAWMKGRKTWADSVEDCKNPDEFLQLFKELGIPGDKWKSSDWLTSKAKLPIAKGGMGENFGGLCLAILEKYQSHPQFVAWMEGKTEPEKTWVELVEECQRPEDFLKLFQELGIPEDKWKSSSWLGRIAKLSIEEGGIGENCSGLYDAIQKRFPSHPQFKAWMGGSEIPKICSVEDARDIIQKEADRLKIRVEDLLNPAKIGGHLKENPVLKVALDYFANSKI